MYPLNNLAPRLAFTRQPSDVSVNERVRAALRAPSPAFSDVSTDVFLPTTESQPPQRPKLATRLAERSQEVAKRALPFWREGLLFAAFVGITTWLAVLTRKMQELENVPFCEDIARR